MNNKNTQFLPVLTNGRGIDFRFISFLSFHSLMIVYLELWKFDDFPHMHLSRTIKFPRLLKQFTGPIFPIGVVTTLKVERKRY